MPDFLIESYDPAGLERPWPQGLPGLRHRRSILVPGDETAFHLVTASSAAAIRAALDRVSFPYERIVHAVDQEPFQPNQGERP